VRAMPSKPSHPVPIRIARGRVDKQMLIYLAVGATVIALLVYLLYPEPLPEPVPAPGVSRTRSS